MAVTTAIAAVASTGYQIYSGMQQKKAQKKQLALQREANEDARKQAKAEADRADIEYNKANRQTADVNAITDESVLAGKGGAAGTMLTGSMGLAPNQVTLGNSRLLGGYSMF